MGLLLLVAFGEYTWEQALPNQPALGPSIRTPIRGRFARMTPPGGHGAAKNQDELDPDEPRTPLWLPLLGLCLFVVALVYLATGQKPPPAEEAAPSASASAPPPAPNAPAPAPQ